MKIVSWNCNGKFREKYKLIRKLNADIFIIQECEKPELISDMEYNEFAIRHLWTGEKTCKGLGIFFSKNIESYELNDWKKYCLRDFISCKINNKINLVGVWAKKPYIEEYYMYQEINISNYDSNTIIMGDFNSNAIWDKKHNSRNHGMVVEKLKDIGIVSAYHTINDEEHGEETKNTFYMYRHDDRPYHIDYCFANKNIIKKFEIMNYQEWKAVSDHAPICVNLDIRIVRLFKKSTRLARGLSVFYRVCIFAEDLPTFGK